MPGKDIWAWKKGNPQLKLIDNSQAGCDGNAFVSRNAAWRELMARAQSGDGPAYHQLLIKVTPYLRHMAARYHRSAHDIEDTVIENTIIENTVIEDGVQAILPTILGAAALITGPGGIFGRRMLSWVAPSDRR